MAYVTGFQLSVFWSYIIVAIVMSSGIHFTNFWNVY